MPNVSVVAVDHQPEFDHSLVPVDYDPFDAEKFANPAVKGMISGLATLPQRAIQNSQYSLDTGNYDPGPTLEAATLPMGTGAIAGVPVRGAETVLGAGPIRAFHGSPHDFDAFSMDKIGTGEGAQAYGSGLYFAENEGVAKAYKKNLAPASADVAPSFKGDGWQVTTRDGDNYGREFFPTKEEAEAHAAKFDKGHMYEVNINADPEHFLDWDKPLSEQHPQTQDAIKKAMGVDYYGNHDPAKAERLWKQFGNADAATAVRQGFIASDDKLVADRLHGAGVPGIKYLDQGSRASGDGSRNYVVFNHDLINIVRKYAAAGIALPPAIAAEYARQFQPVDHNPFAAQ